MATLIDPVCGMTVDDSAIRAEGYDDVAFCAPGCRSTFLSDPSRYTASIATDEPAHSHHGGCHNSANQEVEQPAHSDGCCGGGH